MQLPKESDRSRPGWQDRLFERVDRSRSVREADRGHAKLRAQLPSRQIDLIDEAAKARGMSRSGYVRRATIAFVVHDLGLDWFDEMLDEPGNKITPGGVRDSPLGSGHGDWKIEGLSSYDDDRPGSRTGDSGLDAGGEGQGAGAGEAEE